MYKVNLEGDDVVVRIRRELMDQKTVSRLLDLVNLSAVLEKSRFAEAHEKILARMLGLPTGAALLREPILNKDAQSGSRAVIFYSCLPIQDGPHPEIGVGFFSPHRLARHLQGLDLGLAVSYG